MLGGSYTSKDNNHVFMWGACLWGARVVVDTVLKVE